MSCDPSFEREARVQHSSRDECVLCRERGSPRQLRDDTVPAQSKVKPPVTIEPIRVTDLRSNAMLAPAAHT
jgi:hypothetical protein